VPNNSNKFAGKYGLIYNALRRGQEPESALSFLPASVRRRLVIDAKRKQEAREQDFVLATQGTILDQKNLGIKEDGSVTAPHDLAVVYHEADHEFTINDIQFSILPTSIHISEESHHTKDWVIRTNGMSKTKSGRGVIFISVSLPFVGSVEINTKLRRLLCQIRTLPIVYLENELVRQHVFPNDTRKNMAAAITNAVITTHPEAVDTLICQLSMEIFNYSPFSDNFYYQSVPLAALINSEMKGQTAKKPKPRDVKAEDQKMARPLIVKTPSESVLFQAYYDLLLDGSVRDYSQFSDAKQAEKAFQPLTRMIEAGVKPKYFFNPIPERLNGDVSFTYDVYRVVTNEASDPPLPNVPGKVEVSKAKTPALSPGTRQKPVRAGLRYPIPGILPNFKNPGWGFGPRVSPMTGKASSHSGIDIGAPMGTVVYAVADGVVKDSRVMGGAGEAVQVSSTLPFRHLATYAHLSKRYVRAKQRVKAGDPIGEVGSTGNSTSPHLHLTIWRGGKPIDPWPLLKASAEALTGLKERQELAKLNTRAKELDKALGLPKLHKQDKKGKLTVERLLKEMPGSFAGTVGKMAQLQERVALEARIAEQSQALQQKVQGLRQQGVSKNGLNPWALVAKKIFEDQVLKLAAASTKALKAWTARIKAFEKATSAEGWRMVWLRDGTAVFRKAVTLRLPKEAIMMDGGAQAIAPAHVAVSINNIFARIPVISQRFVTHQYLGSGDGEATISFLVKGTGLLGKLQYMNKYNEAAARVLRKVPGVGVIQVRNEILNLAGGSQYIIESMETETVPSSPELYKVQLRLTEWKQNQEESAQLKQEMHTSSSLKMRLVSEIGRLFSQRHGIRDGKKVVVRASLFAYRDTRYGFLFRKNWPLTFKELAKFGSELDPQVLKARGAKRITKLDGLHVAIAHIVLQFFQKLRGTHIFHQLGWTKDALRAATNDPNHPLYSYGFFDIYLDSVASDPEFSIDPRVANPSKATAFLDTKLLPGTNAAANLRQRISDLIARSDQMTSHFLRKGGHTLFSQLKGSEIQKRLFVKTVVRESYSPAEASALEKFALSSSSILGRFDRWKAGRPAPLNFRLDDFITGKVTTRNGFHISHPGASVTSGFVSGSMAWVAETIRKFATLNPLALPLDIWEKKFAQGLGPKAKEMVRQYPDRSFTVTTLRTDAKKALVAKPVTVTLREEIRREQLRVAFALISFFHHFREHIVAVINPILEQVALSPELRHLLAKDNPDSIFMKGLPAYQDIPLPQLPVTDLRLDSAARDSSGNQSSPMRFANPDFYFFNPDDYGMVDFERIQRYAHKAKQLATSTYEFSQQFGMVPFSQEEVQRADSSKLDIIEPGGKKNKTGKKLMRQKQGLSAGRPGFFAYQGVGSSSGRGHGKQIGPALGTMVANRLPESLQQYHGVQSLQHRVPGPKFWNHLNVGVGDSGISHEGPIRDWYVSPRRKKNKISEASHLQGSHPFNLQRVSFGGAGLGEFRFPVLLDRSVESMEQQFKLSLLSHRRNTHKMRRALPAFKLYFLETDTSGLLSLDKNTFLRSYDDFFSYSSIKEIKFVQSRKVPADLLVIRLSNVLGYLDTLQFSDSSLHGMDQLKRSDKARQSQKVMKLDTEQENPFVRFALKEGVRVNFRFGYENNPEDLENAFNGQIVQINQVSADEVAIVCQSFATQLVAYKKGLEAQSVPREWVDTFDLLSWAICQPEVTFFGRWELNTPASIGESRTTGGWEKIFQFMAQPQDDNIFAPSRKDVISYYADDHGGLWSYLSARRWASAYGLTAKGKNGAYKGSARFLKAIGDIDIYQVEISSDAYTVYNLGGGGAQKVVPGRRNLVDFILNEKGVSLKGDKKKKMVSTIGSYGRGDSALLDFHVYRTTIWDIFQEMELRHPGWISRPVPYGNRMTMFFGQPNQLYWHRPPTALEKEKIRSLSLSLDKKILANEGFAKLRADVLGRSPYSKLTNSWLIRTVMKNPFESILYASMLIPVVRYGKMAFMGGVGLLRSMFSKAGWSAIGRVVGKMGFNVGQAARVLAGGTGRIAGLELGTAGAMVAGVSSRRGLAALLLRGGLPRTKLMKGLTAAALTGVVGTAGYGLIWKPFRHAMLQQALLAQIQYDHASKQLLDSLAGRLIPFRRYHMLTSEHHIVANNIKASVHGTHNAVSLEYTKDAEEVSDLSSPRLSTETKSMKANDRVLDGNVRMGHFSYPNCRGRWMADRYMQGLLMRHMKDTYKGQLLVIGDPRIRPYDRCLVMDSYSGMNGSVEVEQVVHTLSPQTGFLTEITPDLVMYGNNITDLPFDDYMSAKIAWERIGWSEATEAAIRYQGSVYQTHLRKASKEVKATHANNPSKHAFSNSPLLGTVALGSVLGGLYLGGAWAVAGAATALFPLAGQFANYQQDNPLKSLIPFFGTMAIKFYEWTTQRQPLIYQPLFLSGRPFIAGLDMDKVNMAQHILDKFIPVRRTIDKGLGVLNNLGTSFLNAGVVRTLSRLPTSTAGTNSASTNGN